ncbi:hypothetical protein RRG08_057473 [Elysia crispata]|uniref:Uncharacterized protein n=1 Tax=Elysia crispata TaxID=231223 RepID=A0AAE0Z1Q0_9GAST|nr:hypothetical protein RRG08_057473 [Elysia crispata]
MELVSRQKQLNSLKQHTQSHVLGRGGEPARLSRSEWKEAEDGVWVDPELTEKVTDPLEENLLRGAMLAYMAGKGSKNSYHY